MNTIGHWGSVGVRTAWVCGGVAALVAVLSSSSASATDGEATRALKATSANLNLDQRDLPAVERQSSGRDATIARLAGLTKSLLAKSALSDGRVPMKPDCSTGVCANRFGAPSSTGTGRWSDGFDPGSVSAVRRGLAPGQSGKTADGVDVLESEDGTLIHRPGIFSLRVLGNGDSFRFVNHLNDYSKHSNAAIKLDMKGAEALGRKIIQDLDLVQLSPDEELLFLKARQTRFTGKVADPGDRAVAANIYFGRLINGVPVVGAKGSTINIEVIANGDVHTVSMDWSPLKVNKSAKSQRFSAPDVVRRRIEANSPTVAAVACGYVDRGAGPSQSGERLELGCLVADSSTRERYIVQAGDDAPQTSGDLQAPGVTSQAKGTAAEQRGIESPGASESSFASDADAGCSVAAPTGGSSWAGLLLGLGAFGWCSLRRRRWAGRGVLLGVVAAGVGATSVANAASYSTFMYRDYDNNWQNALSSTQWVNYSDWKEEFDDVASCVQCLQPSYLDFYMHGHATTYGSDLIALSTHGTNSNWPNWDQYFGIFVGKAQGNYAYSWYFEAPAAQAGATEIMLLDACAAMPLDNAKMWGGYRNAFRRGNHVIAGCWGAAGQPTCSLYDTGINTTWNEIGDELADSNSTVWFAWKEGFSVGWADDDIVTYGAGLIANQDCDNVASGVGWSNRNNYTDYQFAHDQGLWSTYEVCGYYQTDW
jgi:hypothetical protein